jgi:flagellar biosynthesis anti-sigma factor FlgM
MKIDPTKVAGIYEANVSKNVSKSNIDTKKETYGSRDRIEISKTGAKYNEISALKSKIINEIDKGTSTEKIQRLKSEINNGTYQVSSNNIADAMINNKKN